VAAAALQGYVLASAHSQSSGGWVVRIALIAGGDLLAAPVQRLTGLPFTVNLFIGAGLATFGLLLLFALASRLKSGRKAS
jgi:hypothetical protein